MSHEISKERQEIKKEFQLERMILFSDAVFAIIITIMVIDIKLPESIREMAPKQHSEAFLALIPKLLAYTLSFFLVANFWMRHLKVFSFLKDYNTPVLVLNLFFLFAVSLFPFGVSMISGAVSLKSESYRWGVDIYIGITLATLFTQTLLTRYLIKNKSKLCFDNQNIDAVLNWKTHRNNIYLIPAMGVLVIVFNYLDMPASYSMYTVALLGSINGILTKRYKRKPQSK